jgi:hypothetical protein
MNDMYDADDLLEYLRTQFKHYHDYKGFFVEDFDGPGFVAAFQRLDDLLTRGKIHLPSDWEYM